MTTPDPTLAEDGRAAEIPCDNCGTPQRNLRPSPANREDEVCRHCHLMLAALQRHPVDNTQLATTTATFVTETEARNADRARRRNEGGGGGGGGGNRPAQV